MCDGFRRLTFWVGGGGWSQPGLKAVGQTGSQGTERETVEQAKQTRRGFSARPDRVWTHDAAGITLKGRRSDFSKYQTCKDLMCSVNDISIHLDHYFVSTVSGGRHAEESRHQKSWNMFNAVHFRHEWLFQSRSECFLCHSLKLNDKICYIYVEFLWHSFSFILFFSSVWNNNMNTSVANNPLAFILKLQLLLAN